MWKGDEKKKQKKKKKRYLLEKDIWIWAFVPGVSELSEGL